MPIPKPKPDETEDDFISRCMSAIADEYDDNDQALAICGTQWREREKSMKDIERKSVQVELKEDKEGAFIARIATLDVIDKDGDVTISKAFPNKKVLVSAYQHGSWQGALPVGKAEFREEDSSILGLGELNLKTIAGREHYETLKFAPELIEWSYGFKVLQQGSDKEIDDWSKDHDGARPARILKKVDPFEISPVLLGAGVDTATLAIKAEKKGVIPYKETPLAPEDAEWDAGAEVRQAEIDDLKIMCAWVDSRNPETKSAYKLPHHKASGQHILVWRAVAAAMGALLGARGGVAIPSGDKRGVYNHLSKHYAEFDKEPPEFRALEDRFTFADEAEMALAAVQNFVTRTESLADLRRKEGRVLSSANRERMKKLLGMLSSVASDLKELLDATEPEDTEKLAQAVLLYTKIKRELMEVI